MLITDIGVLAGVGTVAAPVLWLSPLSDLLSIVRVVALRLAYPGRKPEQLEVVPPTRRPHVLFLVPAHNEALLIKHCVQSLCQLHRRHCDSTVVVVVDACTDDTAAIARCAGAAVLDFGHSTPIGKARLLDQAVRRGVHESYDAVVIVDADSIVDQRFADTVGSSPMLRSTVQQGYHSISNPRESWLTRLAALLNSVRYEGQLVLRAQAELNAPLTGNGMCLGCEVLNQHGMHCRTIKEDLELYARYTLAGVSIQYCPSAVLYAQESRSLAQARTQRDRWARGKWEIVRRYAWPICISPLPLRQRLDSLSEITHHGPVLHTFTALAIGLPLIGNPGYAGLVGQLLLASIIPLLVWTLLAFRKQPERFLLLAAFACLPAYVLWRIGVFATGALSRSRKEWRRSPRHEPRPSRRRAHGSERKV